jgi:hypothetical protein
LCVIDAHALGAVDKEQEAPELANFFPVVEDGAGEGEK